MAMARKCFACARLGVGSQDGLDIYFDARHDTHLRDRLLTVPQITRDSPSPSPSPSLLYHDLDSPASIRRTSSLHSFQEAKQAKEMNPKSKTRLSFMRRKKNPVSTEIQNDHLLHPHPRPESAAHLSTSRLSKQGLKQLSGSAPSVTYTHHNAALTPTTSRSRQKKFLRHFNVDPEEMVIDYYSCALVADILLQGHLYISKNYFAFYSNVFGYITKMLIPLSSVVNITKEKTAYILPNAVGVVTADNRHVFSSLLSRDTTHRLMVQVWRAAANDNISAIEVEEGVYVCDESSQSGSESVCDGSKTTASQKITSVPSIRPNKMLDSNCKTADVGVARSTWLLAACTLLLLVLSCTSAILLNRLTSATASQPVVHTQPYSRSLIEIQEYLETNLINLNKVRTSLEDILLMMEKDHKVFDRCENTPSEEQRTEETTVQHTRDTLANKEVITS